MSACTTGSAWRLSIQCPGVIICQADSHGWVLISHLCAAKRPWWQMLYSRRSAARFACTVGCVGPMLGLKFMSGRYQGDGRQVVSMLGFCRADVAAVFTKLDLSWPYVGPILQPCSTTWVCRGLMWGHMFANLGPCSAYADLGRKTDPYGTNLSEKSV